MRLVLADERNTTVPSAKALMLAVDPLETPVVRLGVAHELVPVVWRIAGCEHPREDLVGGGLSTVGAWVF